MPTPLRTKTRPSPKEGPRPKASLWKGPEVDGISFSLFSRFLVCRERFRLKVVEGLQEDEGFQDRMEFGSMWHEAEEAHAAGKPWKPSVVRYGDKCRAKWPSSDGTIGKWVDLTIKTFPVYVDHWKNHPDTPGRVPILEEVPFKIPYKLPSGRTVFLRGKWDAIFRLNRGLWIQENKTKGKVDEEGLEKSIHGHLQTMIYHVALRWLVDQMKSGKTAEGSTQYVGQTVGKVSTSYLPAPAFHEIAKAVALHEGFVEGTLYNVVRRPLSDRYPVRQKKSETQDQFHRRVAMVIAKKPEDHFFRWKVVLGSKDIHRFRKESLDPLLEGLCSWWDSIKDNPWDPWVSNGKPNPLHYRFPFGVYNGLAQGFRGDFFELLTTGNRAGLVKIDTIFPELDGTK